MKKNGKKKLEKIPEKKVEASSAKAVMASKKNKKNKLTMYIVIGVLTFLLALTVAIGVAYSTSKPTIDNDNPFTDIVDTPVNNEDKTVIPTKKPSADGRKQEIYNLLVLGKDYWSSSTDVIMIVSINTAKNDISVLQIPRDSTVDCGLNKNGSKRVNAIYAYATSALRSAASNPSKEYSDPSLAKVVPMYLEKIKDTKDSKNKEYNDELRSKMALEYLKETLKQTFCIAIDGYVMVDVAGFREIVDVLGGVEVDVPQNMDYDDPTQNLHIHLKKGVQVLDGADAEGFVRYRYGYVDGDIGRVNAQKIFLSALAKKVMSFSTVTKIQPLVETCLDYTTTSLSLTDIIGYVKILLEMDLGNIKFYTAPGEAYRTSSGAWYYSLYMDANLEIINQHFNDYDRTVTSEDVTLNEVVNNYNISYNNQGISAEDIDNSELNLTKSNVTYNPSVSTSTTVSTNTNTNTNTNTETNTATDNSDAAVDNAPTDDSDTDAASTEVDVTVDADGNTEVSISDGTQEDTDISGDASTPSDEQPPQDDVTVSDEASESPEANTPVEPQAPTDAAKPSDDTAEQNSSKTSDDAVEQKPSEPSSDENTPASEPDTVTDSASQQPSSNASDGTQQTAQLPTDDKATAQAVINQSEE